MSIMEVLTLLLVIFEVLSYIDGHYYREHPKVCVNLQTDVR